jgi:hypothetical protein
MPRIPVGSVLVVNVLWRATTQDNQPKDIPQERLWCGARTARCAGMPTAMRPWSSDSACSFVIRPTLRKSLTLLCTQRGPRKREVFLAPRLPNAEEGHLPTRQGKELGTRKAPRMIRQRGWLLMHQVFLIHYGSSMSSGHAAPTRSADYVGVPEAAPLERLWSVTSTWKNRIFTLQRKSTGLVNQWADKILLTCEM